MRLRVTITLQFSDSKEIPVFESDLVSPDAVYSTLLIAERTACATLAPTYRGAVCIRKYVGPTLVATSHYSPEVNRQSPPAHFLQIKNKYSGKVLDVSELSTSNGSLIHQWEYLNGFNQQWQLVLTADGYHRITNRLSGKVIEAPPYDRQPDAPMQQWDYNRGENQQWRLVPIETPYFVFLNRRTGKALEVTDGRDGSLVREGEYEGLDVQKWHISKVEDISAFQARADTPQSVELGGIADRIIGHALPDRPLAS